MEAGDSLWSALKGTAKRRKRLDLSCSQTDSFKSVLITSWKLDFMKLLAASLSLLGV